MKHPIGSFIAALLIIMILGAGSGICRQAPSSQFELSGEYAMYWLGPGEETPLAFESGTISFGESKKGPYGWNVSSNSSSGTYHINARGLLTLTDTSGEAPQEITDAGAVSRDGRLLLLPEKTETDPGLAILIKKPQNALDSPGASDLKGERYNYVEYDFNSNGQLEVTAGYIDFDRSETRLAVNAEYSSMAGPSDFTESGVEYTVSADGRINFPNDPERDGIIDKNGDFILIKTVESSGEAAITILVRETAVDPADLYGRYNIAALYADMNTSDMVVGAEPESGYLSLDGDGTWRSVSGTEKETGTYALDGNGRLLINSQTSYGPVSPDGSLILIPDVDREEGSDLGLSFMVKPPLAAIGVSGSDNVDAISQDTFEEETERLRTTYQNVPDQFKPCSRTLSFEAALVTANDTARFQFEANNLSGSVSDMQLIKLKRTADSLEFTYADKNQAGSLSSSWADGTWWIQDPDTGRYLAPSASLDADKTYPVCFVITDNGDYDRSREAGTIDDPTVLGANLDGAGGDDDDDSSSCFITTLTR